MIKIQQIKYLNNSLEQDHCFIKRITGPPMGFTAVHSAAATIAGVETAHVICKGHIACTGASAVQTSAPLAAQFRTLAGLFDLPLNFHAAATGARLFFTPIGAG